MQNQSQNQSVASQSQTSQIPQIKGPEMNDRDRINDVLAMEKYMLLAYNIAANEASFDTLYRTQMDILSDIHQCQRDLFNMMHAKGWYKFDNADPQNVDKAAQKFTNYQTQFPYQ
ncbi:MAG: spore coat protein [Firmicutes bacterium]|uniref:Coat F domain-containing protein n=1 Tax=Melghirimyces thermohalophilus TaxID=1236220 RepID=A0A1G6L4M6_9BACL|nr:spore coat protein [Melghirimyces thermohalophilus]MDA8352101.1 spore coat protein [Bacillota bacterium]SDC37685.1 Coat F domain-containing protein [Melghirimyces thermohalophilus]